jgi:DNA-binding NtrC family response regulator
MSITRGSALAEVLLIDDDDLIRESLEAALLHYGHDVRLANGARMAFKMIEERAPQVIVTDIMMPDIDGIGVVQEVKKRWPALPVIAISGGGMSPSDDILTMASVLGATATLSKPFDIAELSRIITRAANPAAA